jgi:TRAP-type C4-dicarboxylate transport system permease small subunit
LKGLTAIGHRIEVVVTQISRVLNVIGISSIGILMLMITADVIGRFLFDRPIMGTVDIAQYAMVVAVYCSVAYCAVVKGHVSVDLVVSRLPQRVQAAIDSVTHLFSLALFSLVAWGATRELVRSIGREEVSWTINIPTWPFRIVLITGVVMLYLVLLIDLFHMVAKVVKK